MSNKIIANIFRIIPRDQDFLERKVGSNGEIFFDQESKTLRLYDGNSAGGFQLARADLSNISNSDFLNKATAAGISGAGGLFELQISADDSTVRTLSSGNVLKFNGGDGISTFSNIDGEITIATAQQNFKNISVSEQDTIQADTFDDTLTLIAGSNVLITTDSESKSITIAASLGESTNSFSTIAVSGQSNIVADSTTDTLTLVAGSNISITTNSTTDAITIASESPDTFDDLVDVSLANLSIDKIYLQAITRLVVSNQSTIAYRFDQYGTNNNPTIYGITGTTIAFELNATGHPFLIQDALGDNYSVGLVHVSPNGTVSTEVNAQGKDSGTLYWKIPDGISGSYRYQCSLHAAMVGSILVKNFGSI